MLEKLIEQVHNKELHVKNIVVYQHGTLVANHDFIKEESTML